MVVGGGGCLYLDNTLRTKQCETVDFRTRQHLHDVRPRLSTQHSTQQRTHNSTYTTQRRGKLVQSGNLDQSKIGRRFRWVSCSQPKDCVSIQGLPQGNKRYKEALDFPIPFFSPTRLFGHPPLLPPLPPPAGLGGLLTPPLPPPFPPNPPASQPLPTPLPPRVR